MSEAVGLKELLRRKIKENSDEVDKRRATRAAFETKYAEGGVVRGGTDEFKLAADRFYIQDHTGKVHLSSDDLHVPGAKDDKAKPMAGVLLDFSRALQTVVDVGTYGAKKYTRGSWAVVPEGSQRYLDAMMRHLLAMDVDPDGLDKETGLPHLAHVAWNALAVLELQARRKETF